MLDVFIKLTEANRVVRTNVRWIRDYYLSNGNTVIVYSDGQSATSFKETPEEVDALIEEAQTELTLRLEKGET